MGAAGSQSGNGGTADGTAAHPFPVLVVYCDVFLRTLVAEVLALEDYSHCAAANGQDALSHLALHRRPHILILDLVMPVMDGREVLRYLHGNPHLRRRLGVVLSSAAANLAHAASTYQSWLAGTLTLPFTIDQLLDTLAKAEGALQDRLSHTPI
jgi:CheY-like chemotaxis protein